MLRNSMDNNQKSILDALRANLISPMKQEMADYNGRMIFLEREVKRFKIRFWLLKGLVIAGLCLHLWCGGMASHSWLWIIYIILLACL